MMARKWLIGIISVLIVILGGIYLTGYGFKPTHGNPQKGNIVRTLEMADGMAMLLEDPETHSFSVARVNQKLGFLYRFDGGSTNWLKKEEPFQAAGIASGTVKKDRFILGIKIAEDAEIQHIAIGNSELGIPLYEPYSLTWHEVKEHPNQYETQKVVDGYAFFVFDDFTEDKWTIRGFDEQGKLVADKLSGADARYIDWNE
ncbi:hypothetical protein BEP19_09265 [Ammoniphilus oxalaticus]|uniref:Uncharacterized protein n=1 Tax=Ammoniphilus oxalaticus TaxID=66863 RepID=A0A419SKX3_9BACL|nr:hypothetical protein [Ammoniphilus oxalaticus]RKD24558.1 hypothetical protein BEP19_09265 [Ammoniphilus oxalaticus]